MSIGLRHKILDESFNSFSRSFQRRLIMQYVEWGERFVYILKRSGGGFNKYVPKDQAEKHSVGRRSGNLLSRLHLERVESRDGSGLKLYVTCDVVNAETGEDYQRYWDETRDIVNYWLQSYSSPDLSDIEGLINKSKKGLAEYKKSLEDYLLSQRSVFSSLNNSRSIQSYSSYRSDLQKLSRLRKKMNLDYTLIKYQIPGERLDFSGYRKPKTNKVYSEPLFDSDASDDFGQSDQSDDFIALWEQTFEEAMSIKNVEKDEQYVRQSQSPVVQSVVRRKLNQDKRKREYSRLKKDKQNQSLKRLLDSLEARLNRVNISLTKLDSNEKRLIQLTKSREKSSGSPRIKKMEQKTFRPTQIHREENGTRFKDLDQRSIDFRVRVNRVKGENWKEVSRFGF